MGLLYFISETCAFTSYNTRVHNDPLRKTQFKRYREIILNSIAQNQWFTNEYKYKEIGRHYFNTTGKILPIRIINNPRWRPRYLDTRSCTTMRKKLIV